MVIAVNAADQHGVRVLVVNALDDAARRFYMNYGFEPSPTNPLDLMMLIKDIKATIGK
jgi:hypothetical protein